MKDDLTKAERLLLARIESAGRWDHLLHDLSLLIPSFIIIGLGIYSDSAVMIITGMVVYAIFALRTPLHQAKMIPVMKSLMKKLAKDVESPTTDSTLSTKGAPAVDK